MVESHGLLCCVEALSAETTHFELQYVQPVFQSMGQLVPCVHAEAVSKTLGLIMILSVLYLTSARLSILTSNLYDEPMFL